MAPSIKSTLSDLWIEVMSVDACRSGHIHVGSFMSVKFHLTMWKHQWTHTHTLKHMHFWGYTMGKARSTDVMVMFYHWYSWSGTFIFTPSFRPKSPWFLKHKTCICIHRYTCAIWDYGPIASPIAMGNQHPDPAARRLCLQTPVPWWPISLALGRLVLLDSAESWIWVVNKSES